MPAEEAEGKQGEADDFDPQGRMQRAQRSAQDNGQRQNDNSGPSVTVGQPAHPGRAEGAHQVDDKNTADQ
ncbi:hypothetical protein D3C71_1839870 [compost metagenome]